jgi:hypothetical protein
MLKKNKYLPAAKTLFIKRVLDSQKFFIKVFFIALFLRVSLRLKKIKKRLSSRKILPLSGKIFFHHRGTENTEKKKKGTGKKVFSLPVTKWVQRIPGTPGHRFVDMSYNQ